LIYQFQTGKVYTCGELGTYDDNILADDQNSGENNKIWPNQSAQNQLPVAPEINEECVSF